MATQPATDTKVPSNFHKVTDQLWISGTVSADNVGALQKVGITAVLNMTAENDDADVEKNFDYQQLSQEDHQPMPADKIKTGLAFISKHVDAGDKVLVHCQVGRSRSASMITAYLMQSKNLSWNDALAKVQGASDIAAPASQLKTSILDYFKENDV